MMEKTELQKMITDTFTEMDRLMNIEEAARVVYESWLHAPFSTSNSGYDVYLDKDYWKNMNFVHMDELRKALGKND